MSSAQLGPRYRVRARGDGSGRVRRPGRRRRRRRRRRALDAAPRGLSVALLEARDWAAGTSQPLQQADPRRPALPRAARLRAGARGAAGAPPAAEPARAAPGAAGAVPLPLRHRVWERVYVGSGVLLYDTRSAARDRVPRHRHLTRARRLRVAPALRKDALVGAIQYYDAQVDDARHTHDARPHRRAPTARRLPRGPRSSASCARASGSPARASGPSRRREFDVRARQVVNATGVWTDDTQELAGGRGRFQVRASKGIHLVVPRDRHPARHRADPAHREERAVRHPVGPALDHRHHRHRLGARQGAPGREQHRHRLPPRSRQRGARTPLAREDVEGVYAGLRPLLAGESEQTTQAVARALGRPCRCRAWSSSRAASTRRTG